MKTTNSPTQGQPNPRKSRLKVAFGPPLPTANNFSWVGIDFMQETNHKNLNPTQSFFCANTLEKGSRPTAGLDVPQKVGFQYREPYQVELYPLPVWPGT